MNIIDFLPQEAVLPELAAGTKEEVLAELVAPLLVLHPELQHSDIVQVLCEREAMGSTAVGEGVAIPHGKVNCISSLLLAVGRSPAGVDFDAPDKQLCHMFFLILVPEKGAGQHLRLLAQIAKRAKDPLFRSEVLLATDRKQLWQILVAP